MGEIDDEPQMKCNSKKEKISRKKKKTLHRAIKIFNQIANCNSFIHDVGTSCHQRFDYKFLQPIIKYIKFYETHLPAIQYIIKTAENNCEEISLDIDNTWKLGWCWENDNGLYTTYGVMPFQFGPGPKDKTWCWGETNNLCEMLGLNILEIKDEKDFLRQITKKLNRKINI